MRRSLTDVEQTLGDGYIAEVPNRGLGGRFDAGGAQLTLYDDTVGVRVVGFGRDTVEVSTPVAPVLGACVADLVEPSGDCVRRIEYGVAGLTEWWASREEGFEQGWTVEVAPDGAGPLTLELAVEGADVTVGDGELWLQGDMDHEPAALDGATSPATRKRRPGGPRRGANGAGGRSWARTAVFRSDRRILVGLPGGPKRVYPQGVCLPPCRSSALSLEDQRGYRGRMPESATFPAHMPSESIRARVLRSIPGALARALSPALAFLVACGPDSVVIDEGSIVASTSPDIVTVATVSWQTNEATRGRVEYGTTTAYGRTTPLSAEAATDHTAALLGLNAGRTWHLRVVAESGDGTFYSEDFEVTTEDLPSSLPAFVVEVADDADLADEVTVFTSYDISQEASTVFAIDGGSEVAWYTQVEGQCLSAMVSEDGRSMLLLVQYFDLGAGASQIFRVAMDGSGREAWGAPDGHHDFVELAAGEGWAYLAEETREIDGQAIVGDRIVELYTDGSTVEVWSAFDSIPVVENDGWTSEPADWTHANGLAWDEVRERYVVSLYRQEQLVWVDPANGKLDHTFGVGGDLTVEGEGAFGPQHAPELTADGVLLFDNAYGEDASRLVSYDLDFDEGVASLVWSFESPIADQVMVGGSWTRLDDGGSVSAWGELQYVLTANQAGSVVRTVTVDALGALGSVQVRPSLYPDG